MTQRATTLENMVASGNTIEQMMEGQVMTTLGKDIQDDEYLDIELTIQNIEYADGKVAYRAWCKDPVDNTVILTVFGDNEPEIALQAGETYLFNDVQGDNWQEDPGVMYRTQSTVTHVTDGDGGSPESGSSEERKQTNASREASSAHHGQAESEEVEDVPSTNADDIVEEEDVDIILTVETIENVENSSVSYRAWSLDQNGDTVIVTVFENNRPSITFEEDHTYLLRDVQGERWDDGTPGVVYRHNSSARRFDDESDQAGTEESMAGSTHEKPSDSSESGSDSSSSSPEEVEPEQKQEELIIDAVRQGPNDSASSRSRSVPPSTGVVVSAGVTGVAIFSSLFATSIGTLGKAGVLIAGSGIAAAGTYVSSFEPSSKLRQRRKEKHARLFLKILLQDYLTLVDKKGAVRANIMVPDGSYFNSKKQLSILAVAGEYDESELDEDYDLANREGPPQASERYSKTSSPH